MLDITKPLMMRDGRKAEYVLSFTDSMSRPQTVFKVTSRDGSFSSIHIRGLDGRFYTNRNMCSPFDVINCSVVVKKKFPLYQGYNYKYNVYLGAEGRLSLPNTTKFGELEVTFEDDTVVDVVFKKLPVEEKTDA